MIKVKLYYLVTKDDHRIFLHVINLEVSFTLRICLLIYITVVPQSNYTVNTPYDETVVDLIVYLAH